MEVTKLYNVILDFTNEEKSFDMTTNLNALVTHISSNQGPAIQETLSKIQEATSNSVVNSYGVSNLNIVKVLEGEKYFGNLGYQTINTMLTQNSFNITQTTTEIQAYIAKRTDDSNYWLALVCRALKQLTPSGCRLACNAVSPSRAASS